jgi:Uma2 family endonuclease
MTLEDYLALDASSDLRHEWINGEVTAMSGGTSRHAAVSANVVGALWTATRSGPCRPTSSDQRIHVPETGAFLYADAALVCGRYQHVDAGRTICNPSVVFEVLSPSTARHDQGAKFEHYRRLVSLAHIVLIDPDDVHVIHHKRVDGGWLRRDLHDGELVLDDLPDGAAVCLAIAELYDRLERLG